MLYVVNILQYVPIKPDYGLIATLTLQFTFLWFTIIMTLHAIKDVQIVYMYILDGNICANFNHITFALS